MKATADLRAAARPFSADRGPVVVLGNPGSVFTQHLASLWRSVGIDARLVARRWDGPRLVADAIPVMVATDAESPARRRTYDWVERVSWQCEARLAAAQKQRYRRAMGSETSYRPYVSPWLADGMALAHFVRRIRPQFVCGEEAFAYGLATAFCRGMPRILMPWGGDIYMYCETTTLASAAVKYALRHVDLVVPGSTLAADHLHRRFGVPRGRMHIGGLWIPDRERFVRATSPRRSAICARYGIDPRALIVMNVRRFFPAWGADLALRAFREFAVRHPAAHFVMLGGNGTEPFVKAAKETLVAAHLLSRFTLFDGDITIDDCADLMSIADISVSLMRELDMRPLASILEAAACGTAIILGDQPEYRAMARLGFHAELCRLGDTESVVGALQRLADNPAGRAQAAERNAAYLAQHEDGPQQAAALLMRLSGVDTLRGS